MVVITALIGALIGGAAVWVIDHPRHATPPSSSSAPPSNVRAIR